MSNTKIRYDVTPVMEPCSSEEEGSSEYEYELQEMKPQLLVSKSSSSRRQRKQRCTGPCCKEWTEIMAVFTVFYIFNGFFTWAFIEAMLSDTQNTLIVGGCIWIVFVVIFITLIVVLSTRKLREKEQHEKEIMEAEIKRREDIKAAFSR